jgi:hypothetical protein
MEYTYGLEARCRFTNLPFVLGTATFSSEEMARAYAKVYNTKVTDEGRKAKAIYRLPLNPEITASTLGEYVLESFPL